MASPPILSRYDVVDDDSDDDDDDGSTTSVVEAAEVVVDATSGLIEKSKGVTSPTASFL